MQVKYGTLTLDRDDVARIMSDAAQCMLTGDLNDTLSYEVKVDRDDYDPLGKANVNFSIGAGDTTDDRFKGWRKQRLERGFDDTELWNLDNTIMNFILPRLKAFAANVHSYPGRCESTKQWKEMLAEMIWAIEWLNYAVERHADWKTDAEGHFLKDDNGNLIPTDDHTRAMNGWKLFSEYVFDLWD
ncbi:MAG: hypothetical protein MJZ25_15625 [Fibrobacter sp.]|nr:hypothetical protein [Fibrobacter sp.]